MQCLSRYPQERLLLCIQVTSKYFDVTYIHSLYIYSVLQDAPKSGYYEGATISTSSTTLTPQCPSHSPYTQCLARCPQEGLPLYIYRSYQNTSTLDVYGVKEYCLFYRALLQKRPIILSKHIYNQNTSTLYAYGVATISRLLKIIGLFCKRAL